MSAHAIAAEMRAELRRYRRVTRVGGPHDCLQAKDDHCALMERKLSDLVRAIGMPALLAMRPGTRTIGKRAVTVVVRDRVPARA